MKKFALLGLAGYIAPRHLKAIKDTGNELVAALDKFDSVGVMDSYFPDADFFTEYERFDRHIAKIKRESDDSLDYISICTPNYLHDSHIRMALRSGVNAICEKPLVLNPWNVEALKDIEKETGKRVFTILQLRLHPAIIELKKKIDSSEKDKVFDVDLTYITSRGSWYYASWKGEDDKSGGIASNIGIHFFDMLMWIFGGVEENIVYQRSHDRASGYLKLKKARVKWFLSINSEVLPEQYKEQRTYRSITVDGEEVEFSGGFTDLHTHSYKHILEGDGFGLDDALPSIELAYEIRNKELTKPDKNSHKFISKEQRKHPFKK
ncbi:MAG: Gfo/Idh/MocA family oxidoreductase [Flavobacteriaceae bacterium]|nr:Gfo/Idh/MocA family oxidoreductase [Flavobacteriaceae bacterium]